MNNFEEFKKQAAEKAVEYIESGMVIGLGTGSTSYYALKKITELYNNGFLKDIVGIPSSEQTRKDAEELGVPLTTFNDKQVIDITIDGADEVDKDLNLIKGGGGALLREKVLAQSSRKKIIVVDESKLSSVLGSKWTVPVEVLQFAVEVEKKFLKLIGGKPQLRLSTEKPFITNEDNYILDTNFGLIENPAELARKLEQRAGIVEHGLFINLTDEVIVAGEEGIRVLRPNQ